MGAGYRYARGGRRFVNADRLDAHSLTAPVLQEIAPVIIPKQGVWRQAEHPQHLSRQLLAQSLAQRVLVDYLLLQQDLPMKLATLSREGERAIVGLLREHA